MRGSGPKQETFLRHAAFYLAGILFLTLSKIKALLFGYVSPKPFDMSDYDKCFQYDIKVVNDWLDHLREYTRQNDFIMGKNVLELGPGSDLGVGIYLLSLGVLEYSACDVNDLAKKAPEGFYEKFLEELGCLRRDLPIDFIRNELKKAKEGSHSKLNYIVRNDFDLVSAFGEAVMDIVFSQAAFEHFDDVEETVRQLSIVCKPGAVIVAEIDLKTHSRWIRDRDPNNIYRYSLNMYKLFRLRGIPNRMRPFQYQDTLHRHGWENIRIIPLIKKENNIEERLNGIFRHERNQMECLSIIICAQKKETVRV
ncbi:MAG TPA: methyltransferase domain-containing protein [Smithella sp.]|nr:methyltransferase domain-containing protein [Smithella sp.]